MTNPLRLFNRLLNKVSDKIILDAVEDFKKEQRIA